MHCMFFTSFFFSKLWSIGHYVCFQFRTEQNSEAKRLPNILTRWVPSSSQNRALYTFFFFISACVQVLSPIAKTHLCWFTKTYWGVCLSGCEPWLGKASSIVTKCIKQPGMKMTPWTSGCPCSVWIFVFVTSQNEGSFFWPLVVFFLKSLIVKPVEIKDLFCYIFINANVVLPRICLYLIGFK